ncbi:MAG: PAS domain S-box protein, partial [Verrucomicrobiota bacterium]
MNFRQVISSKSLLRRRLFLEKGGGEEGKEVFSFRTRILFTISLLIVALTLAAMAICDQIAERAEDRHLNAEFRSFHREQVSSLKDRRALVAERCQVLAGSPRIVPALERGSYEESYRCTAEELRALLQGAGPLPDQRLARLQVLESYQFAILDGMGRLVPDPREGGSAKWTQQLRRLVLPEHQETGFIVVGSADAGPQLREVTVTPLVSSETRREVGAVVVSYDPFEAKDHSEGEMLPLTGFRFQETFFFPQVTREEEASIRVGLQRAGNLRLVAGEGTAVSVSGELFRAFAKPLNPDSHISVAQGVSLFPLSESIAFRNEQRAQIAGIGGLVLLLGLALSFFLSRGLSKPVELMAEESKENRLQREQAERERALSEEQYRGLFENAVEGIYILSGEGVVVSANPALARICGFPSPEDMMRNAMLGREGCQFGSLYADQEKGEEIVGQAVQHGAVSDYEVEMATEEGNRFWVSQNLHVVDDPQDPAGFHYEGTLVEITKRRRAEEERNAANGELTKALANLKSTQQQIIQQERLRALGEMASGVAHDFNNALTPILGYAEMLGGPWQEENHSERETYLEMIKTSAEDAASVVTRLREFYRPSEKKDAFAVVDLGEVAAQTVKLTEPRWRQQAQSRGITIQVETELAADLPTIMGEASALRESLT